MLDTTGHHELMAFGGGVRVCPGARLAQLEILHLVTNFVKCFQFELVDKSVTEVEMKKTALVAFAPVYKPVKVKKLCDVVDLVGAE
jgi:cytochrome P450